MGFIAESDEFAGFKDSLDGALDKTTIRFHYEIWVRIKKGIPL